MTDKFKPQVTIDAAGLQSGAVPVESSASCKVGIDIGSTTIKVVVLDANEKLVYKKYARHFSDIPTALVTNLTELRNVLVSLNGAAAGTDEDVLSNMRFRFALTGSAGMGIAQRLQLPFVQEVIAAATAVKKLIPQTDTMVELGGEDAKIMYFGSAPEERMNGVCAGGTGAFIDHMAALLNTDAKGLNDLAANAKRIYTIASRCGVFAKTDIQALMNDGASKEDIAKSIFQAVVNQTIGNLAQGREITGNVAFLGGPLYFLPELKKRFVETLKMDPEKVVNVEDGAYFVAVGAALSEETKELEFKDLGRVIWKEVRTALICGACLSVLCFAKVMLIDRLLMNNEDVSLMVAVVVGLTLAVTVLCAKLVGCTLPMLAKKLGFDPAVMASPFITTIVDALSLLVYFGIATTLLKL